MEKMEIDLNKSFRNENIQIMKKCMKTCSPPLVIRDMQIKATMRYHYICRRMGKIKN